mgnify:CR=1 FL=1
MSATILLEALGIEKRYDKFAALAGVDLKVRANTVHSVIGPNGAGKTTLFHMLTGTKTVSGGRIMFDGHDVTREPDHRRVQRGMARSFQVTSLFLTLPVRENLRLAAQGTAPAHALNCWHAPVGARARADAVASVLARLGLERHAETPVGNLSHGQQRRLEVGMALATRPRLLLLDEVAAGLTEAEIEDMARLIRRMRDELDLTVIWIDTSLPEL